MSIELSGDVSKKTEVSLLKIYFKCSPVVQREGSSHEVCLDVGRDPSCALRIQYDGEDSKLYKLISKKHAEILLSLSGVFVRDVDSKNGTFVGNSRVEPGRWISLNDGDCISLGWYVVDSLFLLLDGIPYTLLLKNIWLQSVRTWRRGEFEESVCATDGTYQWIFSHGEE